MTNYILLLHILYGQVLTQLKYSKCTSDTTRYQWRTCDVMWMCAQYVRWQQTYTSQAHSEDTPSFSSRKSIGKFMILCLLMCTWRRMHLCTCRSQGIWLCIYRANRNSQGVEVFFNGILQLQLITSILLLILNVSRHNLNRSGTRARLKQAMPILIYYTITLTRIKYYH